MNNLYFFPWALRQIIGCPFQTSAPRLVEKAESFYETGLLVSLDTSSDAPIPDAFVDWLLDDDEARDF